MAKQNQKLDKPKRPNPRLVNERKEQIIQKKHNTQKKKSNG